LDPGPVPCHPVGIRIGFDRESDMKMTVRAVAAGLGLTLAPSAMAQVALDLKLGYGVPVGNVQTASPVNPTQALSSMWSGQIPVGLGARYRFTPNISLGVYVQYGVAFVASTTCGTAASCSGYDLRTGIELVYAFAPDRAVNPWFSYGTGWEWTHYSTTAGSSTSSVTWSGWEYVNIQAGTDFNVSKSMAVGPYVGFIAGTYSNLRADFDGVPFNRSVDPAARSFHGWFQFGVKGTLNL
jgi:hypothetical protein